MEEGPGARICCILRTPRILVLSTLRVRSKAVLMLVLSRLHKDQGRVCNIGLCACDRPNELVIGEKSSLIPCNENTELITNWYNFTENFYFSKLQFNFLNLN